MTETATRERPVLFSAPMVRAILDGRKTMTRRKWKLPNGMSWYAELGGKKEGWCCDDEGIGWHHVEELSCPYGAVGDRLWVRETWNVCGLAFGKPAKIAAKIAAPNAWKYRATDTKWQHGWRPSIFMPRAASRITLEITDVRVQRLQEISDADIQAEGVQMMVNQHGHTLIRLTGKCPPCDYLRPINMPAGESHTEAELFRAEFASLWETINGAGSWESSPWVWAISFKRV